MSVSYALKYFNTEALWEGLITGAMVDTDPAVIAVHSCYTSFKSAAARTNTEYDDVMTILENGGLPTTYNAVLTSVRNYGQYVSLLKGVFEVLDLDFTVYQ